MASLAIVIVSWNVRDMLRRCLDAVAASLANSPLDYTIVVVDNASSDDTVAMLGREFPHVHVIASEKNLGFAAGNNQALRALGFGEMGDGPRIGDTRPEMVLLLNPDTEPVGDALPQLVRYLETHPSVVAVGPQLRYGDGSIQSSRRRFPTTLTLFCESTLLERLWPHNLGVRYYRCADRGDSAEQRVDWLVGAALLVRGAAIAGAGLLDERFFLYSEELEWQYRLHRASSLVPPIAYLPTAVVYHYEAQSSEQVPVVRHLHFQRSKLLLARDWYGRRVAAALRLLLLAGYGWEMAVEGAKYLVGHRRALRQQRLGAYGRVVWGLVVG